MCGIFGKIGILREEEIEIAKKSLCHRGPDAQVYKTYAPKVNFFHARLSIVDIEGGTQPMETNTAAIIFNGEIYNHEELRQQFGLTGQTRSDTETILLLYDKLGLDMLQHLEGMFAIALYDKIKGQLFLIRDRAGKKPIYFSEKGGAVYFGSEQNLLRNLLHPSIKLSSIAEYLQTGMIYGANTPYEGIFELKPGHMLTVDVNSLNISDQKQWWTIETFYNKILNIGEEEALFELENKLKLAVKRRIESSDLEVGCFLSGGIDSGLVSALAVQIKPKLRTFTVKFNNEYDESAIARNVSSHLGTMHEELEVNYNQLSTDFEKIVAAYGEPFMDDSQIPSYYVAKEAKKHVTVIINGDGGDELFGGYRRYIPFSNPFLSNGAISQVAKILIPFLPAPANKMNLYNYFYRLMHLNSLKNFNKYLSASTDLLFDKSSEFLVQPNKEIENKVDYIFSKKISNLRKVMLADFETILPYILLKKIDISSMQSSLEGRSPFLSKEIMEFAPTLPDNLKVKGQTTKYLLRKLAAKYLPAGNENLPKRGFEVPIVNLIEKDLNTLLRDYLSNSNSLYKSILPKTLVDNLLNNKENISKDKRAKILFSILTMEIWNRN